MNNPHLEHQGLDGGRFLEHRGGQPALPGQIHPPEGGGRITGDVGPEVFPRQLLAALLLVDGDGCQDLALNLVAKAKLLYTGADSLSCLRRVCQVAAALPAPKASTSSPSGSSGKRGTFFTSSST